MLRRQFGFCFPIITLSLALSLTPSKAAGELFQWTDAQGRVHYSDQPRPGSTSVDLESRQIQIQKPDREEEGGAESDAVLRAREKRREIQRWAERESSSSTPSRSRSMTPGAETAGPPRIEQVMPNPDGSPPTRIRLKSIESPEARCTRVYGKTCAEIENWRANAIADCQRRGLRQDCESRAYLQKQRPKTLEEAAELRAKRAQRSERRRKKATDAIRRRPDDR